MTEAWDPDLALGWGIVGPGQIGGVFADCIRASDSGRLVAVSGRSPERTAAFCERHGGDPAGSLDALLERDDVDALYVATPHSEHPPAVRAALAAGKAVLCEKPMTTSAEETRALVAEAEACGGLLVEGWMYRHHPQVARLLQLLREGTLGRPFRFESVFGFEAPFDATQRLWNPALGGGAILDIGGYPVSLALSCAAAATGGEGFAEDPAIPHVEGRLAPSGVDAEAALRLSFPSGFEARLTVAIDAALGETAAVVCEGGTLLLETPFLVEGKRDGRLGRLRVRPTAGKRWSEDLVAPTDAFSTEARIVARLRASGSPASSLAAPAVRPTESVALAALLGAWRQKVGNPPTDPSLA